jgi:hypothetical protein
MIARAFCCRVCSQGERVVKRRSQESASRARLQVVAAGDEHKFCAVVSEMLDSRQRLDREAALEALVERPVPELRGRLREHYFELDADGPKRDPGAHQRVLVAKILAALGDVRDVDVGVRASDTYETVNGVDGTANLRSLGLRLVAGADPHLFSFLAAEHVDDSSMFSPEPARTALELLAGTGHQLSVYQWLVTRSEPEPAIVELAVDLLTDVPASLMARCLSRLTRLAIDKSDEPLLTKLADTIVERGLEDAYPALSVIMQSGTSSELYSYLALLLASTNRTPLLAILEQQLELDILRRPAILAALRVRPTPEQQAILKRWEDGA